ncbi:MAG: tRNA (guanosine(46)-N7)-methyltransferase TrmB [Magnetococcales bacterium]|nr:tRNA (guanosine(46)-N7)-methyltransferase TrmB [Magnetococcales bacterium]
MSNVNRGNPFKVFGRKKGQLKDWEVDWLAESLPRYRLPEEYSDRATLMQALGADPDQGRLLVEVGFGNGDVLAWLAARHPVDRLIGIEVFQEGMVSAIKKVEKAGCSNVRLIEDHAQPAFENNIPDSSLDGVYIHFPDPWRKKRHHKRRLIQHTFLDVVVKKLRPGGFVQLATDWQDYALWMIALTEAHPGLTNAIEKGRFAPRPDEWLETNFQRRGWRAGRASHYLLYRKNG